MISNSSPNENSDSQGKKDIIKVTFQGIQGAYSEQALRKFFGETNYQSIPSITCKDVFDKLKNNDVDFAVLPIENSIVGGVGEHLDYLIKENVTAISEYYLTIEHCLLAIPDAKFENIKKIYSHPVAISQCQDFLRKRSLEAVPFYDTAGAAKMIAELKDPTVAAIASGLNAGYYNLQILASQIQSSKVNITRFLVITNSETNPFLDIKREKTSLALRANHTPGSLLKCLKVFSDHNVNLTKIESRPIPENPWEYIFFIEIEGSAIDPNIAECLKQVQQEAFHLKLIGSYPLGKKD